MKRFFLTALGVQCVVEAEHQNTDHAYRRKQRRPNRPSVSRGKCDKQKACSTFRSLIVHVGENQRISSKRARVKCVTHGTVKAARDGVFAGLATSLGSLWRSHKSQMNRFRNSVRTRAFHFVHPVKLVHVQQCTVCTVKTKSVGDSNSRGYSQQRQYLNKIRTACTRFAKTNRPRPCCSQKLKNCRDEVRCTTSSNEPKQIVHQ